MDVFRTLECGWLPHTHVWMHSHDSQTTRGQEGRLEARGITKRTRTRRPFRCSPAEGFGGPRPRNRRSPADGQTCSVPDPRPPAPQYTQCTQHLRSPCLRGRPPMLSYSSACCVTECRHQRARPAAANNRLEERPACLFARQPLPAHPLAKPPPSMALLANAYIMDAIAPSCPHLHQSETSRKEGHRTLSLCQNPAFVNT